MNLHDPTPSSERLQRLTAYLDEDPQNTELLAEACDAALACGRPDAAADFLASAERLAPGVAGLQARRAHMHIARGELGAARKLLEQLHVDRGNDPVLLHDLAYVHLLMDDAQAAHDLLAPGAGQDFAGPVMEQELLQSQWLRACHHLGLLEVACAWAARVHASGSLRPAAAGVASLLALDQDDQACAGTWADMALAANPGQHEALLTRGCLAMAAGDVVEGARFLERARQARPEDGRTLGALGMAHLFVGKPSLAGEQLERAVAAMPVHAPSWQALGWARLLLGQAAEALSALRRAVQLDEASAEAHAALALATALAGDAAGAAPILARAEALAPQDELTRLARACLAGDGNAQGEALQRLLLQWRPRP